MSKRARRNATDDNLPLSSSPLMPVLSIRVGQDFTVVAYVAGKEAGRADLSEMGVLIGNLVEQIGQDTRVEVHDPGGRIWADVLAPGDQAGAVPTPVQQDGRRGSVGGFLPREEVHAAIPTATLRAGRDGQVTVGPWPLPLIVYGPMSGTIHYLTAQEPR